MKFIKLLGLGTLGYLFYQIWKALAREAESANSSDLHRALNQDAGRMDLNEPGRGTAVEVQDSDGAHSYRKVGRGVVHRS